MVTYISTMLSGRLAGISVSPFPRQSTMLLLHVQAEGQDKELALQDGASAWGPVEPEQNGQVLSVLGASWHWTSWPASWGCSFSDKQSGELPSVGIPLFWETQRGSVWPWPHCVFHLICSIIPLCCRFHRKRRSSEHVPHMPSESKGQTPWPASEWYLGVFVYIWWQHVDGRHNFHFRAESHWCHNQVRG